MTDSQGLLAAVSRFTPTGVGKITRRSLAATVDTVHPHGRGENEITTLLEKAAIGSPPRAWGKCLGRVAHLAHPRFIPTGVGKMGTGRARLWTHNGSPPRAWGKSVETQVVTGLPRFTPTGVGKIAGVPQGEALTPVHPHGRGENQIMRDRPIIPIGSPPRAWGKWSKVIHIIYTQRFTPTGVGKIEDAD